MSVETAITALSDGELARRIAAAEGASAQAAEAELCRRFAPRVRLYGLRHLRTEDAAQDLAQQAMVLVLTKLRAGAVREPDRVGSFVLGCARMLSRERGRHRAREIPVDETPEAPVDHAILEPPADPFASERLARCLEAADERERTVLVMTYYDEQTSPAIAEALGLSAANVRVIRHRGIARLRDCLGLAREVT